MSGRGGLREDLEGAKELIIGALRRGYTPLGGPEAGTYVLDKRAVTLMDCLVSCCETPACNTLLFLEGKCYLIACNVSWPRGCEPRRDTKPKFADAFMLPVRSIGA